MSLIADALRAAQDQRAGHEGAARSAARRLIVATEARAPVRPARSPRMQVPVSRTPLPRSLRTAALVFGCAVAASGAIVAIAPRPSDGPAPGADAGSLASPAATSALLAAPLPAGTTDATEEPPAPGPVVTVATPPAAAPVPSDATEDDLPPRPQHSATPAPPPRVERGRFELTVDPQPRSGDAFFRAALQAQLRRDYEGAAALYRRFLQQVPDSPDAWSNLGAVLSALGDGSAAEAALAEAIRLDTSAAGVRVNLANLYLARGLTAEARAVLEEAVRLAPDLPEAHYALGRLLESENDRAGAIREYELFLATAARRFPHLMGPVRERVQLLSRKRSDG